MKQYSKEELQGKYVVAFDTMCGGWECVHGGVPGEPYLYESEAEAQVDCEEENGDFVIPAEEYVHGRTLTYGKDGFVISGTPLCKDYE